jgi:hypothetical protein
LVEDGLEGWLCFWIIFFLDSKKIGQSLVL